MKLWIIFQSIFVSISVISLLIFLILGYTSISNLFWDSLAVTFQSYLLWVVFTYLRELNGDTQETNAIAYFFRFTDERSTD